MAVKTGRRPPPQAAQCGLDGREHGVTLNQVGSAQFLSLHTTRSGWLTDLLPAWYRPLLFLLPKMVGSPITRCRPRRGAGRRYDFTQTPPRRPRLSRDRLNCLHLKPRTIPQTHWAALRAPVAAHMSDQNSEKRPQIPRTPITAPDGLTILTVFPEPAMRLGAPPAGSLAPRSPRCSCSTTRSRSRSRAISRASNFAGEHAIGHRVGSDAGDDAPHKPQKRVGGGS